MAFLLKSYFLFFVGWAAIPLLDLTRLKPFFLKQFCYKFDSLYLL